MRGTRSMAVLQGRAGGIIPADAGNTSGMAHLSARIEDHPRGCGEHSALIVGLPLMTGSSPRMRGTRSPINLGDVSVRIIPADAGNTGPSQASVRSIWDHPRGCGEHLMQKPCMTWIRESSPRMRGTLVFTRAHCPSVGIIPADAGNTLIRGSRDGSRRDHPRGCGEHGIHWRRRRAWSGSSPRMRGTPDVSGIFAYLGRIIPADAGNTLPGVCHTDEDEDHPRGCKEHLIVVEARSADIGSSPRMRGTPSVNGVFNGISRIIPADAGNTSPWIPCGPRCPDHPRGCGEHAPSRPLCPVIWGSSPRMRGTLAFGAHEHGGRGIIPADAGNTANASAATSNAEDHPRGCGEHE